MVSAEQLNLLRYVVRVIGLQSIFNRNTFAYTKQAAWPINYLCSKILKNKLFAKFYFPSSPKVNPILLPDRSQLS